MPTKLIAGDANLPLAEGIARAVGVSLSQRTIHRFPNGELHVEIQDSIRGDAVEVVSVRSLIAEAIDHLREGKSLAALIRHE